MPRGRTGRTAIKRAELLKTIGQGFSVTTAAARIGMSRRSVYDWRDADPSLARDLEAAFQEGTDRLVDAATLRALLPDHDALLIFLLKQRDPLRFNRKMIEHTGEVDVAHHVAGEVPEELVHFYMPSNCRDEPDHEDTEPLTIDGEAASDDDNEAA
jgi:hypothetical protein